LLDLLDGDVDRVYAELALDYRPRYTPVVQVLAVRGTCTIQDIARAARITHSAASQTVAQMAARGLVEVGTGQDLRRRIVRLSPKSEEMLPILRRQWTRAAAAAAALDAELPAPLTEVARAAIDALERVPFRERMRIAARSSKKTVSPLGRRMEALRDSSR
jgi:DNA-binding MarR family transcriptional regulator